MGLYPVEDPAGR